MFPVGPMGLIGPGPIRVGPMGPLPGNLDLLDLSFRWADQDSKSARASEREQEAKDREREQRDRERERAEAARDRENSLFEQGTSAMDEARWDRALSAFTRLAELKGSRADRALYWKSYAQNRLGQQAEALATISELTRSYPTSSYLKDARALEVEVRGRTGQPVRPESQADEDLKLLALNSLANSDASQAIPIIEGILNGTGTPRLKAKALFVLAQMGTPRAQEILKNVAKSGTPELQSKAIQYLGVHGGPESRATLAEVYSSTNDVDVKRRILRAFMTAGEKNRVLSAAQTESNPELRVEAVRLLGAMGASDELWQLYQKETSGDVKRQILSALQVSGNVTRMIELAKGEKDPELRRLAVRNLGVMGSKGAGDALVEIYSVEKDAAVRKTVVNALFVQGNATALVALARKEQDMSMKAQIVQQLANMDSKVARDYMIELLK
jgi:HEAT repeat protein